MANDRKDSYDYVSDAVRQYWRDTYPQDVIAYFYQKYDYDTKWEWCEELVECRSSDDYQTTIFNMDFCEGQTCVKDIAIVPLKQVTSYYANALMMKNTK